LGITIVSPADGALFVNTNPLSVLAVASVTSGAITNVEFFVDDQKFGQDRTVPYTATWSGVVGGVHRLIAIGQHNSGISYTSTPVTVSFPRMLLAQGAVWKYLDNGTDQGTNWIRPNFDDSAWPSGPAELGYGDGDEATLVGFGLDANN